MTPPQEVTADAARKAIDVLANFRRGGADTVASNNRLVERARAAEAERDSALAEVGRMRTALKITWASDHALCLNGECAILIECHQSGHWTSDIFRPMQFVLRHVSLEDAQKSATETLSKFLKHVAEVPLSPLAEVAALAALQEQPK